jgi:hypothetical protein
MITYGEELDAAMRQGLPHKVAFTRKRELRVWADINTWISLYLAQDEWGNLSVDGEMAYYFKHERDAVYFALKWVR